MLKTFIAGVLILLIGCIEGTASGWNDYVLDIGDGYSVFRTSSIDICIGKADGEIFPPPTNCEYIGPLTHYYCTPEYIFTKHIGLKQNEHSSYNVLDPSREYYFVFTKNNDRISFPLSQEEFQHNPAVQNAGVIKWKKPENPNVLRPLLGAALFIVVSIVVLLTKYYWIILPLIAVTVIGIRAVVRVPKSNSRDK